MRRLIGQRGPLRAVVVALGVGLCLAGGVTDAQAKTFTVNSYGEQSDAFPGDGVAEIQAGTGITTFHAAIEEANASLGPDTIVFQLVVNDSCGCLQPCKYRLEYVKPLPPVNDPSGGTTIDFSGASWMTGRSINSSLGPEGFNAALVLLSANNVVKNAHLIQFPGDGIVVSGAAATGNTIQNSTIGFACPGYHANAGDGVRIEQGASANLIADCLIVESGGHGIRITGEGSDGNGILRSYIGESGGSLTEVCDVRLDEISELTELVVPDNCTIETAAAAFEAYRTNFNHANRVAQVAIDSGASENTVGGIALTDANFIGGSFWKSEFTRGEYPGCGMLGVLPGSVTGSDSGIILDGENTTGNRVQGNYIGYRNVAVIEDLSKYYMRPRRDMTGFAFHSVHIRNGASGNTIGHENDPSLGNQIAYSFREGILIEGSQTQGNRIANNSILSEGDGVVLRGGTKNNEIGLRGNGNTIRAREYGVEIDGEGTEFNTVVGNQISGNGFSGVALRNSAAANTVGGTVAGDKNELNSNCSDGIVIFDPGSSNNEVLGNEIADNGEIGVFLVNGATDNIIGGSTAGAGNDIHDNEVTGVEIHDLISTGNRILGNKIHQNGTRGVFMVDGTSGNIVGGVPLAERNEIYGNALSGIEINGPNTFENQIRLNSIFDNSEKGILLSFGANQGIEAPTIQTFVPFAGTAPPNSFVDIFSDSAEEGRFYINSTSTDEDGNFSIALDLSPYLNTNLTTTATDDGGNTSEFSGPIAIIPPQFTEASADRVVVEGDDFSLGVSVTGAPVIRLKWQFRTEGGDFADLADTATITGVLTTTLAIENAQLPVEGYYRCVADNGLGGVNSREIFVRVVNAGLNELEVNSLGDASDGNTSSFAQLLAAPGADGVVTLREAILAANTMPGENTIRFSVEGDVQLQSVLPAIGDTSGGLVLDGMGELNIDGDLLVDSGSGLTITSAGNQVKGITFQRFPEHGLVLSGSGAVDNTITGCAFGVGAGVVKANGGYGLLIMSGASDNQIGGTAPGARNLFAGNANTGITLDGNGTTGNRIQGNTIGQIDVDSPDTGNTIAGVLITNRASDNLVGGESPEEGNNIMGNTGVGVWVVGGFTVRNTIINNTIFGNGDLGIRLFENGNANVARPEITSIAPVTGTAPPNSRVDCYIDDDDEGELFQISVMSNADGLFSADLDLESFDGRFLNAIATDVDGNTSAFSRKAAVDFTPPVLTLNGAAMMTLACGAPFSDPGATASDNIDGNLNNEISVAFEDASASPLASLDGVPPGNYTVRYTVSDNAGLEATPLERSVTVEDIVSPVITLNGASTLTIACGEAYEDAGATATDTCDNAVEVMRSGTVDTSTAGVYELTFSAQDASGNQAENVVRTITLVDEAAPFITLQGEAIMALECGQPFVDPGAIANDACEGEVSVTVQGSVNTASAGTYTLTYNATDAEGNKAVSVTRTVEVADTTAPVLTLTGEADLVIQCGQGYSERGATLTDSCDPSAEVIVSGQVNANTIGVYNVTYTATDAAGNAAESIQRTVSVIGQNPPQIFLTGNPTVTVACNGNYQDAGANAIDGCQADISSRIITSNPVLSAVPGTYTVTYNVEDGAGTAAEEVIRTVTVLPCATPCDAQCVGEADDAIDEDGDGLSLCKEKCAGSSDQDIDSDNDGMSDEFEYRHQLNLKSNDADLDPDLDGFTNLEEYLEGGSPRNPATPVRSFYVSPLGTDQSTSGTREEPWQTLGYALTRLASAPVGRNQLFVDAGVYVEDITLPPNIPVRAQADALVEIMGTVVAPANSTLRGVTLSSDASDTALLFITGSGVTIRDCTFNGEFGVDLTGIMVEEESTGTCAIEGSLFENLLVGVNIAGAVPAIRQCQFINIASVAIVLLDSAQPGSSNAMGEGLNGWNDFSQIGPGLAISNLTGTAVSAQFNEWGTENASDLQALVEGDVTQSSPLPEGGASAAAALEVVVFNGTSQARVRNAQVTITGSGGTFSGVTDSDGRLVYPLLGAGSWQISVRSSGFPDLSESVNLVAGSRRVINFALLKASNPDPGGGTGGGCPAPGKASAGALDRKGDLVILGLLVAGMIVGQITRARRRNPS